MGASAAGASGGAASGGAASGGAASGGAAAGFPRQPLIMGITVASATARLTAITNVRTCFFFTSHLL